MNPSSVLGMLSGVCLLVVVVFFTTDNAGIYWNMPGLAIVLGGTIAATLLSYPLTEVLQVFRVFMIIFLKDHVGRYARENEEEIVTISRLWYQADLQAVETELEKIKNPFLRTGIQLVIDGTPLPDIHALLQWRINRSRAKELAQAQIFRTMAAYAPAFGMLGTLFGLINMLYQMQGTEFESIGRNMGIALITTLYGILLANLIFKPIAIKFERRTDHRVALMNIAMEGIMLISERRSPAFTRELMHTYMEGYEAETASRTQSPNKGDEEQGHA